MTRILFIGNSYTGQNDLAGSLVGLGLAADPIWKVETRTELLNGMALKTHWERGTALEAIRTGGWDFVSLQEQSTLPVKNPARVQEYLARFHAEIEAAGARTVLYLSWTRQAAPERQADIDALFLKCGRDLGAVVAPVGPAWAILQAAHPEVVLYKEDGSHPTPAGTYIAACCFFGAISGRTPVGQTFIPTGVSVDQAGALQQAAWDAVRSVPRVQQAGPSGG